MNHSDQRVHDGTLYFPKILPHDLPTGDQPTALPRGGGLCPLPLNLDGVL